MIERSAEDLLNKNKEIQNLLREHEEELNTPGEFVDGAFLLAAQRGDIVRSQKGKPDVLEHELGLAQTSEKVRDAEKAARVHNLSDIARFENEMSEVEQVSELIAKHVDEKICYHPFIRRSVREPGSQMTKSADRWNRRNDDMVRAGLTDEQRALFYAQMLAQAASDRLSVIGEGILNSSIDAVDPETYWVAKLGSRTFGEEGVAFSSGFKDRVEHSIREAAQKVFPDDAERVLSIAKAINYIKTSEYKGRDLSAFRKSVYTAIKDGRLDSAEALIREKIEKNRNAFTIASQRNFETSNSSQ